MTVPQAAIDAARAADVGFARRWTSWMAIGGERLTAVLEAAAPHIAAAEHERWRAVLAEHYLMGINCDPDTKRDNPMCGCSRIHLGWHPSMGEAHQAWIEHVAGLLEPAQRQARERLGMSALNATAKATLRAAGISQAGWARAHCTSSRRRQHDPLNSADPGPGRGRVRRRPGGGHAAAAGGMCAGDDRDHHRHRRRG